MIIPSNSKAVIFDLNGTIINDDAYHARAFDLFLARHGIDKRWDELHGQFQGSRNDAIMPVLFGDLSPEEIAVLSEEKEAIYRELYADAIVPVAGFHQLFSMLKERGLKVGLATSSPVSNVQFVLTKLGLEWKFDAVVRGDEVVRAKPDPEIYLVASERLEVAPGRCLVFEDSLQGIASAQAAGMPVVVRGDAQAEGALGSIKDFTEVGI